MEMRFSFNTYIEEKPLGVSSGDKNTTRVTKMPLGQLKLQIRHIRKQLELGHH